MSPERADVTEADKALRRVQRLSQRLREADEKAGRLREELRAEIVQARLVGVPISDIARTIGVSRQRVQQLLRQIEQR